MEQIHAALYQKALDNLGQQEEMDYYVCSVSGYTCENKPLDKCPVCQSVAKAFFKVA